MGSSGGSQKEFEKGIGGCVGPERGPKDRRTEGKGGEGKEPARWPTQSKKKGETKRPAVYRTRAVRQKTLNGSRRSGGGLKKKYCERQPLWRDFSLPHGRSWLYYKGKKRTSKTIKTIGREKKVRSRERARKCHCP